MRLKILFLSAFVIAFYACNKATSTQTFKFSAPAGDGVAAKAGGITILEKELITGIESDIYEEEMKIFDIKQNKLKTMLLEKFMESDPAKKGLTNDDYMNKFIVKNQKVTEADIEKFIKEKNIPKEQITPDIKDRIKQVVEMDMKRKAVDEWIFSKAGKDGINVYFTKPQRPVSIVEIGDAPVIGNKDAKVKVVEYSDFQCPYCKKGAEVISDLKKKYGSKVVFAFKNFPLPFHNQAEDAANAALCAREQGGDELFWKMHDTLFGSQDKLDIAGLKELGKTAGVKNLADFNACIDSKKHLAKVKADYQEGQKIGVKSTPTFYVNGQLVMGAQPIEVFSELIDEALAK